jgi:rubrerythrin
MGLSSIDDILDFAIRKEEEAVGLYEWLADNTQRPGMKEVFEGFADQERAHKEKLLRVKRDESTTFGRVDYESLGIAEQCESVDTGPDMNYAEALQYAMSAEQAAYELYAGLAGLASDEQVAKVFFALANEELGHKRRFELEFKAYVLDSR